MERDKKTWRERERDAETERHKDLGRNKKKGGEEIQKKDTKIERWSVR